MTSQPSAARTGAPLACSRYVHLPRRASIGAKRQRAATELRDALGCDVIATWDDDDAYGADRLARQAAPIAAGAADATVATPYAWRWEDDAGRARTMTWGGLAGAVLHRLDGDLGWGTELLDEAIASLCYDARLPRLPPRAPDYVHVKHAAAAARGPLTE